MHEQCGAWTHHLRRIKGEGQRPRAPSCPSRPCRPRGWRREPGVWGGSRGADMGSCHPSLPPTRMSGDIGSRVSASVPSCASAGWPARRHDSRGCVTLAELLSCGHLRAAMRLGEQRREAARPRAASALASPGRRRPGAGGRAGDDAGGAPGRVEARPLTSGNPRAIGPYRDPAADPSHGTRPGSGRSIRRHRPSS
jgi:hypothetical protein